MSKIDAMRAMREAKYAERQARSGSPTRRPTARPPVAPPVAAPTPALADDSAVTADDGRCGHRSINGRTCTRERGHSAKSHRYG
jgi:hypothetical protein